MAVELRNTGIDLVGSVPWGSHFCHFYATKPDLFDVMVPFFRAGLEANESCIWVVVDAAERDQARDQLRRAVPDLDRREASGDLELVLYDQWLLDDGSVDVLTVYCEGISGGSGGHRVRVVIGHSLRPQDASPGEQRHQPETDVPEEPAYPE